MRLWGLLPFLILCILLWGIQEPELAEGFVNRVCPKRKVSCKVEERSQCTRHTQCPKKHKCCQFACGKMCLNPKEDVCRLPLKSGPCSASITRWGFRKATGVCTEFTYGGCKGNPNNFPTEDICKSICKK